MTILIPTFCLSQDIAQKVDSAINLPSNYFNKISNKASELDSKITNYTEKAFDRLEKQELKLKRKLARKDSIAAVRVFGDVNGKYRQLREQLKQKENHLGAYRKYLPQFDTLKTSLNFLTQNPESYLGGNENIGRLKDAVSSMDELNGKIQGTEQVRRWLVERRVKLNQELENFGLVKDLKKYNKVAYFYAQQVKEYQDILQDPRKREQKALELITKLPAFQKFFSEHSELASLFPLPGGNGTAQSLAGLQTRLDVQSLMQQQLAAAGPNAGQVVQQGIQQAQAQLNQLKDKINKLGGSSNDIEMPDYAKSHTAMPRNFWRRLEVGANMQNVRSSTFVPSGMDIGLSLGYKVNTRSILGIGASYSMAWDQDIRRITLYHNGIGLRSFLDLKLKGKLFVSGGYEKNYRTRFNNIQQLRANLSNWQQSGLIGLSKKYSLGKKWKGDFKLLFDFLYKTNIPVTQPVYFRLGYSVL